MMNELSFHVISSILCDFVLDGQSLKRFDQRASGVHVPVVIGRMHETELFTIESVDDYFVLSAPNPF